MTSSAFAFHNQIVEQQGIDPTSDAYYEALDRQIKEAFLTSLNKPNNLFRQ